MTVTMTMTLRKGQPTSVSGLALQASVKGSSPREKGSDKAVVPCALRQCAVTKKRNDKITGSC